MGLEHMFDRTLVRTRKNRTPVQNKCSGREESGELIAARPKKKLHIILLLYHILKFLSSFF